MAIRIFYPALFSFLLFSLGSELAFAKDPDPTQASFTIWDEEAPNKLTKLGTVVGGKEVQRVIRAEDGTEHVFYRVSVKRRDIIFTLEIPQSTFESTGEFETYKKKAAGNFSAWGLELPDGDLVPVQYHGLGIVRYPDGTFRAQPVVTYPKVGAGTTLLQTIPVPPDEIKELPRNWINQVGVATRNGTRLVRVLDFYSAGSRGAMARVVTPRTWQSAQKSDEPIPASEIRAVPYHRLIYVSDENLDAALVRAQHSEEVPVGEPFIEPPVNFNRSLAQEDFYFGWRDPTENPAIRQERVRARQRASEPVPQAALIAPSVPTPNKMGMIAKAIRFCGDLLGRADREP